MINPTTKLVEISAIGSKNVYTNKMYSSGKDSTIAVKADSN
ncbi:hypothetical protein [Arcobacter sp. CECT 8989]|nr:hypothetical protein [Arcobacter sp. CECT 8989]